jgi:amidase
MVGVIGVAPGGDPIRSEFIGSHGGNMDNTMMREGATLILPVQVEGALVAVGDVHAAMGDGEINCSALEAPATVTLSFKLRKDLKVKNPILINNEYFSIVASQKTLDEAVVEAVTEMAMILKERLNISFDEVSMLMSAVGHVQICQVVNVLKTVRYLMPIYVLETYGFTF